MSDDKDDKKNGKNKETKETSNEDNVVYLFDDLRPIEPIDSDELLENLKGTFYSLTVVGVSKDEGLIMCSNVDCDKEVFMQLCKAALKIIE